MLKRAVGLVVLVGGCTRAPVDAPESTKDSPTIEDVPVAEPGPGICSANGWCWQLPLPQGERIDGLIGKSGTEAWGVTANTLLAFDGQRWTRNAATPEGMYFSALSARASGGFWAAGWRWNVDDEEGKLFAWDGEAWRDSGTLAGRVTAMWAAHDRDVWLAISHEDHDGLARWDGESLRTVESPTRESIGALAGTNARDVWLAADDGLFHFDGERWSRSRKRTTGLLVRGRADVWAADEHGVHHLEDAKWRSWPVPRGRNPRLYDGGDGSVWMIADKHVLHYDGQAWHETGTSIADRLGSNSGDVWGASDGTAWIGGGTTLMRWDGRTWSSTSPEWFERLHALWGVADDDVWIGGERGLLAHWDGRAWTRVKSPATHWIVALWGTASDDVWAVAEMLMHWDGRTWSRAHVDPWTGHRTVWGSGPDDVWAAGDRFVVHFDGCWWSLVTQRQIVRGGVSGASSGAGEQWLAMNGGLDHLDAGQWKVDPVLESGDVLAVYAARTGPWVLGDERATKVLFHRSRDASWTRVPLPTSMADARRHPVHVASSSAVWIAGARGDVHRWDGRAWHDEQQDLVRDDPSGLWVSPSGGIWMIGGTLDGLVYKRGGTDAGGGVPSRPRRQRECGPDPTSRALEDALSTSTAIGVTAAPTSARDVAMRWLEAMRDADVFALARLSALPLTVKGFVQDPVANDVEGFRKLLSGVFADPMSRYVPYDDEGAWDDGGLTRIRSAGLAKQLAHHRDEVVALEAGGHALVQASITDGRGVTIEALLALRETPAGLRVSTVLFDSMFEE
jgi:hypothetical protein